MERRGRIPVATFRTIDGKPRSRSRAREINITHSDPEMDTFTLLEENFAIKEENEKLKLKIAEYVQNIKQLEEDNLQLRIKIKDLKKTKPEKLIDIQVTAPPFKDPKLVYGTIQNFQSDSTAIKESSGKLQDFLANPSNEFESLLDIKDENTEMIPLRSVHGLMSALSQLKTNYSNAELQLYEANEEISVLLEYISQIRGEEHNMLADHRAALNKINSISKEAPVLSQSAKEEDCKISAISVEQKSSEELADKEIMRSERIVEVVLTL